MIWLPLDRSLEMPLTIQVYSHIRKLILSGEFEAGRRLPSTRQLALDLHVSRTLVMNVYEQLFAEGYIYGRHGAGTYVADQVKLMTTSSTILDSPNLAHQEANKQDVIDFRSGIPALDYLPRRIWGRLTQQVLNDLHDSDLGYGSPEGRLELRTAIARHLLKTRGICCNPEQIIITSGAAQAFAILAKLLLSSQRPAIVEDPIIAELHTIFTSQGSSLYPVAVDEYGMKTELLPEDIQPGLIFVTPSHQFPMGGILSAQRRIQLVEYARKKDCYIVEDDYDSEFRYNGFPISTVISLEPQRVLYVGTFSKILFPALRIGYMILPQPLLERCRQIKWCTDLHTPTLEQLVLAKFIDGEHLLRHTRKMRKVYQKRRQGLIKCLTEQFPEAAVVGDATGLHIVADFAPLSLPMDLVAAMSKYGVKVYPVEIHAIAKGNHRSQLILGYGHLTLEEIKEGISRLKNAFDQKN